MNLKKISTKMPPVLLFFAIGAFTIISQTIIIRDYIVVFNGNEFSVGTFFASWFFWIAASATVLMLSKKLNAFLEKCIHFLIPVYALSAWFQIEAVRLLRLVLPVPSYEQIPPLLLFSSTFLINAPLSILTGIIFSAGCGYFSGNGKNARAASLAYIIESAGSFCGGICVTLLLSHLVNSFAILSGACLLLVLSGLMISFRQKSITSIVISSFLAVMFLLLLLPQATAEISKLSSEKRLSLNLPQAEILDEVETPYKLATIASVSSGLVFLENNKISFALPAGPDSISSAALYQAEAKGLKNILVCGMEAFPLMMSLLDYNIKEIVVVEIDKHALELLEKNVPEIRKVLNNPKLKIISGDPGEIIVKNKDIWEGHFDMVYIPFGDPETLQINRYYTVEFFNSVREVLSDRGFVSMFITSAENFMSSEKRNFGFSVLKTLEAVFNDVIMVPGERSVFLASGEKGSLTLDPEELKKRYENLESSSEISLPFPSAGFETIVQPDRVSFLQNAVRSVEMPPEKMINTNEKPLTLFLSLLLLFKYSDSAAAKLLKNAWTGGIFIFLIPLLIIFAGFLHHMLSNESPERKSGFISSITIFSAGGASITFMIMLISEFQAGFGILYEQIGLISAVFMAGLSSGAVISSIAINYIKNPRIIVIFSLVLLAIFSFFLPDFSKNIQDAAFYHLLFLNAGFLAGAVWPAVSGIYYGSEISVTGIASRLQAFDHWGAAAGAFSAGVIALPVMGFKGTSFLLSVMFALVLLLYLSGSDSILPEKLKIFFQKRDRLRSFGRVTPLLKIFAIVSVTAIILNLILSYRGENAGISFELRELKNHVQADEFQSVETPFMHYLAKNKGEILAHTIAVSSMAVVPGIKGFAGSINLLLVIDLSGIVKRIFLLESKETPTYVRGMDRWLLQFSGHDIRKDFVFSDEQGIDAMSGATITSDAALKIINETKRAVGEKLLHVEVERASSRSVFSGFLNARIIYLFLAFAGLVFVHFFGSGNIRFIFLIFNFVVGGLIFNVEMSISHLLTLFRFDYPSFDNTIHFILITGVLVLSVLFGPVYCAHMCPFGAGQEILGRISHFRIAAGEKVEKAGRFIKYGFLASVAVCVFHPSQENLFSSDPLQNAFSYRFDFVSGLMILLIAVFSLFFFRFFCRTLCPVGAFLNIFNKLRISWLCRPERNYSNCDLGARHSLDIDCLQCNRCVNDHNINVGGASAPNI